MRAWQDAPATTNSTDGIDLSAAYIVENNLAPIMSMSFQGCEFFLGTSGNLMFKQLWQQGAAQASPYSWLPETRGQPVATAHLTPHLTRHRHLPVLVVGFCFL